MGPLQVLLLPGKELKKNAFGCSEAGVQAPPASPPHTHRGGSVRVLMVNRDGFDSSDAAAINAAAAVNNVLGMSVKDAGQAAAAVAANAALNAALDTSIGQVAGVARLAYQVRKITTWNARVLSNLLSNLQPPIQRCLSPPPPKCHVVIQRPHCSAATKVHGGVGRTWVRLFG